MRDCDIYVLRFLFKVDFFYVAKRPAKCGIATEITNLADVTIFFVAKRPAKCGIATVSYFVSVDSSEPLCCKKAC